ncbi:hypothetical protein HPB52_008791 [Rhipicephalus sanguineus]|uniref:Uncharacterized protein n=1 Tax=Rhipicephalus sanguineus TaxID=34632 RepID=A0A9D4PV73_RHISA|nr:hypothetical protein HPB52_008791 [Rhipicephalus sanguineus]
MAAAAALAASFLWRLARAECPAECHDEVSIALPIIGLLVGCALSLGFCHLAIRLWMRRRESAFLRTTAPPVTLFRPQPPRLRDTDPVLSGAMPGAPAPPPPCYGDA